MSTVTFQTDGPSERALAELTADGSSVSEAICRALADAVRQRRRAQMRRESLESSMDASDRAESRQVLNEMADLRV